MIITIPMQKLVEVIPQLFHNKVVIAFVGACTKPQAQSWISTFNAKSPTKLTYKDALVNSLFVAIVHENQGGLSREQLINKRASKVDGWFATINPYQSAFDP